MKKLLIIIFAALLFVSCLFNNKDSNHSRKYPSFGNEIEVTVNGLSFDSMEPFVSPDGRYLFFNSLNSGGDTKLFYATRVNDSTFNFEGELDGANQETIPHLDAVPDMDSNGNFYWTSTRNYPAELNNLFRGTFNSGTVSDIERVQGNFNMGIPGWLVMDHGISWDGQLLYFNNARFDDTRCQVVPCETIIGVAQKNADSTFSKLPNSASILKHINNPHYINYAPCITKDNLELYYSRFLKGAITANTVFEICVAVRSNPSSEFSEPKVLFSADSSSYIEAPTLTVDKRVMYYHKKTPGLYKIVMRYRSAD